MQEIIIDEQFRGIMPILDEETYRLLEENILENGCRDALVLWNDILIDGYNRYRICTEHDIPFETVTKGFGNREEVLIWLVTNQISRRNLSPIQLSYYRGLHYRAERKLISNARGKNQYSEVDSQNGNQAKTETTMARLAKQYKVSKNTVNRDTKLSEGIEAIGQVSPEAKTKILSGEVEINKKKLQSLSTGTKEEIEAIAMEIEEGTYKKRTPAAPASASTTSQAEAPTQLTPTQPATPARPATPPPPGEARKPASLTPEEMQKIEKIISDMTNGFDEMLNKLDGNSSLEDLRDAIKDYIDKLENLCRNI